MNGTMSTTTCAMQSPPQYTRRKLLAAAGLATGLAVCAMSASAQQAYPSKPITLIIGNGAGTGGDLICRVVAAGLSAALKQQVIVDNRVGANSAIAGKAVVHAKPDGYTLLFGSASGTVINQAVQKTLPFDSRTDLMAIAQVGSGGVALVATPDFPANGMKEFIALTKANPGKYDYATWGIGTSAHLVMEWMESHNGIKMNHVPYKSMTAIIQDMQGGMIRVGFTDVASAMPFVKQGRLKVLGLTGSARSPGLPDARLMSEQGIEFATDGWYGLFAPKGTPQAIVTLLNQEVTKVMTSPAFRERLLQLSVADAPVKSPEEFAKTVKDDLIVWEQIARTANIRLD